MDDSDVVGTLTQEAVDFAKGGALTLAPGTWLIETSINGYDDTPIVGEGKSKGDTRVRSVDGQPVFGIGRREEGEPA